MIIGCKTLETELQLAVKMTGCKRKIRWIQSGLHNSPSRLRTVLQEMLNDCTETDTVLLAMGFCGNAVEGLRTGSFELVVPRVDDCITLLLGSQENRRKAGGLGTYFLTEGWLKGEKNIWQEYQYTLKKYGKQMGKQIFQMMLEHYQTLALLDSGSYPLEETERKCQKIAGTLGLKFKEIPASLDYLIRLLKGDWDSEHFLIIPPNDIITNNALMQLY